MVYLQLKHLFITGTLLIGSVLGDLLGNPAYTVVKGPLGITVFTTGYKDGRSPLDKIVIDEFDYKLTVKAARNAHDQTPNRLYLSEIMLSLWSGEGHLPQHINTIMFSWVVNEDTKAAIANVRSRLGLGSSANFDITADQGGWDTLLATPLVKTAAKVATVARKRIFKISVIDEGLDDVSFALQSLQ